MRGPDIDKGKYLRGGVNEQVGMMFPLSVSNNRVIGMYEQLGPCGPQRTMQVILLHWYKQDCCVISR